jgi:hypothetical protein
MSNVAERQPEGRHTKVSPKEPRVPSLRFHKASGRAYVVLSGKAIYLGLYGEPATEQRYHQRISEWVTGGKQLPADTAIVTVKKLLARFWAYAEQYYRTLTDYRNKELEQFKLALRPLKELYADTLAAEFGPRSQLTFCAPKCYTRAPANTKESCTVTTKTCRTIYRGLVFLALASAATGCQAPWPQVTTPAEVVHADNAMLPDGRVFRSWEVPHVWTRTYHVAQRAANASDDNPGTQAAPWKTISKAAVVLQPGQRVIVHEGVYREWVSPARGGTSPTSMIGYMAAEGEKVVITATDVWRPTWQPSRNYFLGPWPVGRNQERRPQKPVYRAELTGDMFTGANVFCLQNYLIPWGGLNLNVLAGYELKRGQLFLDGKPIRQVSSYRTVWKQQGVFFVEENGMAIHLRLPNDESPAGKTFEITTREQVFAPTERFLNYILLSGFTIFGGATGIPVEEPQRGSISTNAGNHWIIQDCEVAHANSIGIDIGLGFYTLEWPETLGGHILRRNHIHHCGVDGIAGWYIVPNQDLLIEDNLIEDIGLLNVGSHHESAGVKIHYVVNSLIRRNVMLRMTGCPALWLDGMTANTRITQNLFYGPNGTPLGACAIEISQGPVLIDNNIALECVNHGIYEHDSARLLVLQNLCANGGGGAVNMRLGNPDRKDALAAHPEGHHRIYGNILTGFPCYVALPNRDNVSDWNVLGTHVEGDRWKAFQMGNDGRIETLDAWREMGYDRHSERIAVKVDFDEKTLTLRVTAPAGAKLPRIPSLPKLLDEIPSEDVLFGNSRRSATVSVGRQVAPAEQLLTADFLGRANQGKGLRVGPLNDLPLDGSPVRVDPRRTALDVPKTSANRSHR